MVGRDAGRARAARRGVVGAITAATVYLVALAVNRASVEVRGRSMEPTLWPGDRLLTRPSRWGSLRPGQVVVVRDPADADHLVVKRLTAVDRGRVEVHGDNPRSSTDSRVWGEVPADAVRRVVVRRWPDLRTRLDR